MVDAEDARLVDYSVERRAQRLRGREVTEGGLLDDNARAAGAARLSESLDHLANTLEGCEIMQRVRSTPKLLAECGVGAGAVVATDVVEADPGLREDSLVEAAAVLLDTLAGASLKLCDRPVGPRRPMSGLRCPRRSYRMSAGKIFLR